MVHDLCDPAIVSGIEKDFSPFEDRVCTARKLDVFCRGITLRKLVQGRSIAIETSHNPHTWISQFCDTPRRIAHRSIASLSITTKRPL